MRENAQSCSFNNLKVVSPRTKKEKIGINLSGTVKRKYQAKATKQTALTKREQIRSFASVIVDIYLSGLSNDKP